MASFVDQLRRNAVALISVAIAITSLGYNTWRNEVTEGNRNIRSAGMEIIQELSALQQVVLFVRFKPEDFRGEVKVGWAHVLAVSDYAAMMPGHVMVAAEGLAATWEDNFEALADKDQYEAVDREIEAVKDATLAALAELD